MSTLPAVLATSATWASTRGRIHRIDMCRFGGAACPADLAGYLVELGQGPAGQEYSCSLAGERACHRAAH
jgi:hypothetical protein